MSVIAKKVYTATCSECKETRTLKSRPKGKSDLCFGCSVKEVHKKNMKKTEDLKRYWYFCPTCPSVRGVVSKRKSPYCRECIEAGKKASHLRKKKRKSVKIKSYTSVGTDGAKRNKVTVKFQVVDEKTMEAPVKKKKDVEYPQSTPKEEADMIAKFLSKSNKK